MPARRRRGLLALYLGASDEKLPEALAAAQKRVSLEPGDSNLQIDLAQVLVRMHRYDEAEALTHRVQANAADSQARNQADSFLTYVRQARAADASRLQSQSEGQSQPESQSHGPAVSDGDSGGSDSIELHTRNPNPTAEGVVTRVSCEGDAIQITVQTGEATVVLRAADRTKVDYTSDIPAIKGDIEPCTELKGHTAKVVFIAGRGLGEIVHIGIEK
jgi:hypothetical protein